MLGVSPVGEILALSLGYSGAQWLEWSLMASALSRPGAGHHYSDFFGPVR
jgi:hypothetical protein